MSSYFYFLRTVYLFTYMDDTHIFIYCSKSNPLTPTPSLVGGSRITRRHSCLPQQTPREPKPLTAVAGVVGVTLVCLFLGTYFSI